MNVNTLRKGQSAEISRHAGIVVSVERSGCGKWLRFVRSTAAGFVVFRTCRF